MNRMPLQLYSHSNSHMKFIQIVLFCLVFSSALAQNDTLQVVVISPYSESLTERIQMLLCDQKGNYIYNNNQDTLRLTDLDIGRPFCECDPLQVFEEFDLIASDSVQVARHIIVFKRSCEAQIEEHGGTYDQSIDLKLRKYEVWDIDRKELLFEAVSDYKTDYAIFDFRQTPSRQKGTTVYHYQFSIDDKGKITIKNARGKDKELADKPTGVYQLDVDGNYILLE